MIVALTAALFGWNLLSERFGFIVVGAAPACAGLVEGPEDSAALTPLVQVALVWVLFAGAARLPMRRGARADHARVRPLATLGSELNRRTVLFVGWLAPRGLASLVFALLAMEALGRSRTRPSPSSPSPSC